VALALRGQLCDRSDRLAAGGKTDQLYRKPAVGIEISACSGQPPMAINKYGEVTKHFAKSAFC